MIVKIGDDIISTESIVHITKLTDEFTIKMVGPLFLRIYVAHPMHTDMTEDQVALYESERADVDKIYADLIKIWCGKFRTLKVLRK